MAIATLDFRTIFDLIDGGSGIYGILVSTEYHASLLQSITEALDLPKKRVDDLCVIVQQQSELMAITLPHRRSPLVAFIFMASLILVAAGNFILLAGMAWNWLY